MDLIYALSPSLLLPLPPKLDSSLEILRQILSPLSSLPDFAGRRADREIWEGDYLSSSEASFMLDRLNQGR